MASSVRTQSQFNETAFTSYFDFEKIS